MCLPILPWAKSLPPQVVGVLPPPQALSPTSVGLPQVVGLRPSAGFGEQGVPPWVDVPSRGHHRRRGGDPVEAPSVLPPPGGVWGAAGAGLAAPRREPRRLLLRQRWAGQGAGRVRVPAGPLPAPRLLGSAGKWGALTTHCRGPSRRESEGGVTLSKLFQVLQDSTGNDGSKGTPTQHCRGQDAGPTGGGGFGGENKAPYPELTPLPTLLPQVSVE